MVPTLADPSVDAVSQRERLLQDAVARRDHAAAVLESLLAAKAECELELAKGRRTDAIKSVTGKSSLDRAIASTRKMIETLDRTVSQLSITTCARA